MPVLCFDPPWRRATSPRLFIACQQAGEGGEDHEMFFFLNVGIGFLLQQRGERLLSSESIVKAGKSPNTLRPVGVYPPLKLPLRGRKRRLETPNCCWRGCRGEALLFFRRGMAI